MAIQDGPGPTMAATNGPPGPAMAAIIGPPLPSLVPWPGDLPCQPYLVRGTICGSHGWSRTILDCHSWSPTKDSSLVAAANGPGPTKAAEIGEVEMAEHAE